MKSHLIISIILLPFICNIAFANDTLIQKDTGGNLYSITKSSSIKIIKEELVFDLFEEYYTTSVSYKFSNNAEECSVEVGFPSIKYINVTDDLPQEESIRNFQSTVNGESTNYVLVPANIQLEEKNEIINSFYMKEVTFPSNSITDITISYQSSFQKQMGFEIVEYLIGSAISWDGIDELFITINLHSDSQFIAYSPELISIQNNPVLSEDVSVTSEMRTLNRIYNNINLDLDCQFKIIIDNMNSVPSGIFGLPWDYNFEFQVYSENEFNLLTNEQLRIARNTIFAWHGYLFKDQVLNDFFEKTAWYKGRKEEAFSESNFNDNERKNLELILRIERNRKN